MELKITGTPKQCDVCDKIIPADGISVHVCGIVYCTKCMKELHKAVDNLSPSLEFSRETFVKLP